MSYGIPVILETERLLFRPHIMSDMEAYCAMEQDLEVRRYVGGQPRSREDAESRFMKVIEPVKDRMGLWATVFKPEGSYIGRCGLYPHFKDGGGVYEDEASIAYYVATAYWGRGLATEAANAFVQFGFNELNLNRIVTTIQAGNDASVHIIKKLGFELISTENGLRSFYHFALQNPACKKIIDLPNI
jgi:ribosomal-protein-alanine N-acetyltransferase